METNHVKRRMKDHLKFSSNCFACPTFLLLPSTWCSVVKLAMTGKSSLKPADWNIFSVFVATVLGMMILSAKALKTQPYKNFTLSINNT
jgi:hypothetical protein